MICNKCGNRRGKFVCVASPNFPYEPIKRIRCPKCIDQLVFVGYVLFDTMEEGLAAQVLQHLTTQPEIIYE